MSSIDRIELRVVEKPLRFVVSPPAGETGLDVPGMPLVHEAAADGTGPCIEVFVAAPHGEVGIPIVQLQGRVADGMGEIHADPGADTARRGDQRFHVERLSGEILHARQQHQTQAGSLAFDALDHVLRS